MKKQQFTIRFDGDLLPDMTDGDKSMSDVINRSLRHLKIIRSYALNSLKGMFTKDEWLAIVDCLNGTVVADEFRFRSFSLIASLEDADLYEGLGARYSIDIKKLCNKLDKLSPAQVDAVYCRIEAFWNTPDNIRNAPAPEGGEDFMTRWANF